MSEVAWFAVAWAGGLVGGFACGWTAAGWYIRTRARRACRACRRLIQETLVCICRGNDGERFETITCDRRGERSSDVTLKSTLDGAPSVRVRRQPPQPPHPNLW